MSKRHTIEWYVYDTLIGLFSLYEVQHLGTIA